MSNIYTIQPNLPFADTIAKGIIEKYGDDPVTIANILLLVPNKRAAKTIKKSFFDLTGTDSTFIPRIQPIGDIDEQDLILQIGKDIAPPAISGIEQHMMLVQLVKKWATTNENIISDEHAIFLAKELANLLNEVEKEQLSFDRLENLVPESLATHMQSTLEFLQIISKFYPEIMKEKGYSSPTEYRNLIMAAQCELWQDNTPEYPVIAAGEIGSIPATKQMLKTIIKLPEGMIILPAVDLQSDEYIWNNLDAYHPEFATKQFLHEIGVSRTELTVWQPSLDDTYIARANLIREAMRPAATTEMWNNINNITAESAKNLYNLNCNSIQEEAGVIATIMRESLETPDNKAMLITNNKKLSKYVISALRRWDIECNDSSGKLFKELPIAIFMQLITEVIHDNFSPIKLLSLIKYPLTACGESPIECLYKIRQIELEYMLGVRQYDNLEHLAGIIQQENLSDFIKKIADIFAELSINIKSKKNVDFVDLLDLHIQIAEKLATTAEISGHDRLWNNDEEGRQYYAHLQEIKKYSSYIGTIETRNYPAVFNTLTYEQIFRPPFGLHPRLNILTPSEARLQHADIIIMGDLNQGSMPENISGNLWMNKSMQEQFGLPKAEIRIGQSAHDFCSFLYAKEVYLTRAVKLDGKPTVASPWLLRLQTVLQAKKLLEQVQNKKGYYIDMYHQLSQPHHYINIDPPAPKPPLAARPTKYSVTQIEKLNADPYAVYANKILNLRKLDPIDKNIGFLEFGNFIHDVINEFLLSYDGLHIDDMYEFILSGGKKILGRSMNYPIVRGMWWTRFERIARWLVDTEQARRSRGNIKVHSEEWISCDFNASFGTFTINAKVDRMEVNDNGSVWLVDYKTGTPPSDTKIAKGYAPQMTLEAAIVQGNGIAKKVESLEYWRITGGKETANIRNVQDHEELIENTKENLFKVMEAFADEETPYLSQPNPDNKLKYNDYEHLARNKEWAS